jgi:hypothetical protein
VVASYLNHASGKSSRRIEQVLSLCREVLAERTTEPNNLPEWESIPGTKSTSLGGSDLPFPAAVMSLNAHLRQCRYHLAALQMEIPTKSKPQLRISASGYRSSEEEVANRLIQLTVSGDLDYLRRCKNEECNRWFFALKGDQQHCSSRCTQKLYRRKPESQEGQRLDQRVRYWNVRLADLKAEPREHLKAADRKALDEKLRRAKAKRDDAIQKFAAFKTEQESKSKEKGK